METAVVFSVAKYGADELLRLSKKILDSKVVGKIDGVLNPSELSRHIYKAIKTARDEVPDLFFSYQKDGLRGYGPFLYKFFQSQGALSELQKPLQSDGETPNAKLLTDALLKKAQRNGKLKGFSEIGLDKKHAKDWMQVFVDAYFQESLTFLKYQQARDTYYKQLNTTFGYIDFEGLSLDINDIRTKPVLSDIFVLPDIKRQKLEQFESWELSKKGDQQTHILEEQRYQARIRSQSTSSEVIPANQILEKTNNTQRAVILGAPGTGKTTLIKHLIVSSLAHNQKNKERESPTITHLKLSQYFPILIRIRDLSGQADLSVLNFLEKFAKTDLSLPSIPNGFFEYWLDAGQALIMIDGLDEAVDNTKRRSIVKKIDSFLSLYSDCPAIISSRPAGYRNDYFNCPHYELLPLDNAKIREFINRWYNSPAILGPGKHQLRQNKLYREIENRPRIHQLARYPLLLTLIVTTCKHTVTLPKKRSELYERAIDSFLCTWEKAKEGISPLLTNESDNTLKLMRRLAYWIHLQGSVNEKENGTQIDRDTLITQLCKFMMELPSESSLDTDQARKKAIFFLDRVIAERTGLLSKQGYNRYAFVHKTFQEYLCSQHIQFLAETNEGDLANVIDYILEYLHNPHWQEVLLLLLSQQTPQQAEDSLRAILNTHSDFEQWLHRDLLFASNCLAEHGEITDEIVIRRILKQLVDLEVCQSSVMIDTLRRKVQKAILSFRRTPYAEMVSGFLERHQEDIEQWHYIECQLELAPSKAVKLLIKLLRENVDNNTGYRAAAFLLSIDSSDSIKGLLNLLKHDDIDFRHRISETLISNASRHAFRDSEEFPKILGNITKLSRPLIDCLIEQINDETKNRYLIDSSELWLLSSGSGITEPSIVSSLEAVVNDVHRDVEDRAFAAKSLLELTTVSSDTVRMMTTLLDDKSWKMCHRVMMILAESKIFPDKAMIDRLLNFIHDNESPIQKNAFRTLEELSVNFDRATRDRLTSLLLQRIRFLIQKKDTRTLSDTVSALEKLEVISDEFIDILILLMQDDYLEDGLSLVGYSSAKALGRLCNRSDKALERLIHLIENKSVRRRTLLVSALSAMESPLPNLAINGLRTLANDRDQKVSYRAWESLLSLPQIGSNLTAIISGAFAAIKNEGLPIDLRFASLSIISTVAETDEHLREEFILALRPLLNHRDLRFTITQALFHGYDSTNLSAELIEIGYSSNDINILISNLIDSINNEVKVSKLGNSGWAIPAERYHFTSIRKSHDSKIFSIMYLGEMGRSSDESVSTLLNQLTDRNTAIAGSASVALENLSKYSCHVLDCLLNTLNDEPKRISVLDTLGRIEMVTLVELGYDLNDICTVLVQLLKSRHAGTQLRAAKVLVKFEYRSNLIIFTLNELLKHRNPEIRLHAAEVLIRLGQTSEPIISTLLQLLECDTRYVFSFSHRQVNMQAVQSLVVLLIIGQKDSVLDALLRWIEKNQGKSYVKYGIAALRKFVES